MKFFSIPLLAIFLQIITVDAALARRAGGVHGYEQQMRFVTQTLIPHEDNSPLSLCILTKKRHVFFMGYYRSLEGYVLAKNNCAVDGYFSFSAEQLIAAKAAGLISNEIPNVAKMTPNQYLTGFLLWPILLIISIFGLIKLARKRARRNLRINAMGNAPENATKIIDAMCHAAKADGHIDANEVTQIASIGAQVTGMQFPIERVRHMIDKAEKNLSIKDFEAFGEGLTPSQRLTLMRGVLLVVASDGHLDKKENVFIGGLARGLNISRQALNNLAAEVFQRKAA